MERESLDPFSVWELAIFTVDAEKWRNNITDFFVKISTGLWNDTPNSSISAQISLARQNESIGPHPVRGNFQEFLSNGGYSCFSAFPCILFYVFVIKSAGVATPKCCGLSFSNCGGEWGALFICLKKGNGLSNMNKGTCFRRSWHQSERSYGRTLIQSHFGLVTQ